MRNHKIKLFLIPFAGGNSTSYRAYEALLKDTFLLYPLELAGHGYRMAEPLHKNIFDMRDDLIKQIEIHIDEDSIIYGHSIGGLLGYLVTLYFEQKKSLILKRLIVSGRANPALSPTQIRHNLPQNIFFQQLKSLGGMPKEFFEYPELHELFEPILRADFEAIETFDFKERKKIETPISVLYGLDDNFSIEEVLKWRDFSREDKINFHSFEGGHFFINQKSKAVCKIIKKSL